MATTGKRKAVWIDCDPGHDDAIALLLAFFAPTNSTTSSQPALDVIGVSTVHGNASGSNTYLNAIKLLSAYKVQPEHCKVWRGTNVPLLRSPRVDEDIHGQGGLGGVECLPDLGNEYVQRHLQGNKEYYPASPLALVSHLLDMLQDRLNQGLAPISIVATGPLTNIALLIKMCPGEDIELLKRTVDKIVIMGGAAGVPGNRTPLAGELKLLHG